MRPLYALLYILVNYSLRLFYRQILVINKPRRRHTGTIYVSNHPSSFMDPLVIGSCNYAVVRFMTRSDVFKWWLKPILWGANMLPIFRQHDGADTKSANSDSFKKVNDCLRTGGNILIFGEGFTDDIPVRSLKPVKKGAVRMGFNALESMNWQKEIHIATLGLSYADRHRIGSDVVMYNNREQICLNDYKEQYLAQPNKTINEVTKVMEAAMQNCIIYVADRSWTGFHENVMCLTGKGFNHETGDAGIQLEARWQYGKNLAAWLNAADPAENQELIELKKETESYFALLKRMKIPAEYVPDKEQPHLLRRSEPAFLLLTWPLMIIGLVHGFLPYIFCKRFTERSFGRKVFWGSVKMMTGNLIGSLYNIGLIIAASYIFDIPGWYGAVYFFIVPLFCAVAYRWFSKLKSFTIKGKVAKQDLSKFSAKKDELKAKVRSLIPVA
jgi:hypothetical protein